MNNQVKKIIALVVSICTAASLIPWFVPESSAEDFLSTLQISCDFTPSGDFRHGDGSTEKITGWVFSKQGAAITCAYSIDEDAPVTLERVTRNDVASAFENCSQTDCGYNTTLDIDSVAPGSHSFRITASDGNNSAVIKETQINIYDLKYSVDRFPDGNMVVGQDESFNLTGWVFDKGGNRVDCSYILDNRDEITFEKVTRNDVRAAFPQCSQSDCGFNTTVCLNEIPAGGHTVTVIAKSGSYSEVIKEAHFNVTGELSFCCDRTPTGEYFVPKNGDETVRLTGWAFCHSSDEVTRCYYRFDSGSETVLPAVTRNDVAAAFPDKCRQTACGYNSEVSIAGLSAGRHTVVVTAVCGNYRQVVGASDITVVRFTNGVDGVPRADYSLAESHTAHIGGWVFSSNGKDVETYYSIDGGAEYRLKGIDRSDVTAAYSACAQLNCGYYKDVLLDRLSAGEHRITVTARLGDFSQVLSDTVFNLTLTDYTVTYNANGGSGAPSEQTKLHLKKLTLSDAVPSMPHRIFKCWNTSADGSGASYAPGGEYKLNADLTLYAVWDYDTFELNGGSGLKFDPKKKEIYGSALSGMGAAELENCFANDNACADGGRIMTGSCVSLEENGSAYDCAYAVVFGELNSDGAVDGQDAVVAACISAGMLDHTDVGQPVCSAADCDRDGKVGESDISAIADAGVMLAAISQDIESEPALYDDDFTIASCENGTVTGERCAVPLDEYAGAFNYFGLIYSADCYVKGILNYISDGGEYSEVFFLEPAESGTFRSFTDGCFEGRKNTRVVSAEFTPIDSDEFTFCLEGFSVFNRELPDREIFISNDKVRIGADTTWGGAMTVFEDLDSNVETVASGGRIIVDSDASSKYSAEALDTDVNLINRHDCGRLVQQSYYGTDNYDMGFFNGHYCAYNPVQGGNQFNDCSKIVDISVTQSSIYVKCRPLDWAKEAEYICDAYMESTYTLCGAMVKVDYRIIDFSGYDEVKHSSQENPAFYCIEPLNMFVYPTTEADGSVKYNYVDGLENYGYAKYPAFSSSEQWCAFTGDDPGSFGIGLYAARAEMFVAGVYGSSDATTENPDISDPTSYIAGREYMDYDSFKPLSYDFYITSGTVDEIRSTFLNNIGA